MFSTEKELGGNRMKKKLECIVCGRIFYQGQGIVLSVGKYTLTFHSKNCAMKFFKTLLPRLTGEEVKNTIKEVLNEFSLKLSERRKRLSKKL